MYPIQAEDSGSLKWNAARKGQKFADHCLQILKFSSKSAFKNIWNPNFNKIRKKEH